MTQKHLTSYVNAPLRLYKEILYKRNETKVIASFSREMVGSIVLFVFLCLTIPFFDAFSLKKRHSPLFQPNPFWDYQDFAEKNDFKQPGSIGVEIAEPIGRLLNKQEFDKQLEENEVVQTKAKETGLIGDFDALSFKKRHSPLFQPNPFWDYQDFAEQNVFKQPGSIGVEIREPIVRPFSHQDFSEQNPGPIGVEIQEPVLRPLGTIHLLRNH